MEEIISTVVGIAVLLFFFWAHWIVNDPNYLARVRARWRVRPDPSDPKTQNQPKGPMA